jgi:cyanophycinase-like exopeptidase
MSGPKSVYLLAGGRGSANQAVFQAVFEELAKPNPIIAYLGAANNDDKRFFGFMAEELMKAGPCRLLQAFTASPTADLDQTGRILDEADAVFVSGGDVEAGINILKARDMLGFLGKLYNEGKLFFGASAGSIMLGSQWVKWDDPNDESSAELLQCLGIAPVICDTHAEGDDWVELKAALRLKEDGSIGYGIPSGGCLKVCPDGQAAALGKAAARYASEGHKVIRLDDLPPV